MTTTAEWFIEADLGLDFITAGTTTRAINLTDANSQPPWNNLNLGLHVGDDAETVKANRQFILSQLKLPSEPFWLEQVHGIDVVEATLAVPKAVPKPMVADASYSTQAGQVLAVMTADCLPIILASENADWIATVHCGWRTLSAGILEKVFKTTAAKPEKIRAWLGPSIGAAVFEVGEEVKRAFLLQAEQLPLSISAEMIEQCFTRNSADKYLADLAALARIQLQAFGVKWIKGGEFCSYADAEQFFSYRRDGETGRMATLAWIK